MFMCGTIVRIATRNRMDLNFNDNSEIATILHWRCSRHIDKLHNFKINIVNQHLHCVYTQQFQQRATKTVLTETAPYHYI